jgi:hypothetical protein
MYRCITYHRSILTDGFFCPDVEWGWLFSSLEVVKDRRLFEGLSNGEATHASG